MATDTRVPAWIRRRISARPVARWIAWNAGRPRGADVTPPVAPCAAAPTYRDNVVFLFRRTA